ncbi:hypothetical protein BDV28DRAFT_159929 [Aspergillus coremiiformis]|uniref:Prolyl 4-hydroxylase alpha subunit domain-containing protein n=1 Tax=Aspergillus coremiiformis TaxID=138285 RepID=A0A5N6YXB1_9EURO|nr:hypothetical protein BDV28DRAFT_159929 [Aspergillus coremiiformis]
MFGYHRPASTDLHVQIFSQDPFIAYIDNFVSHDEIDHLLKLSKGRYKTSMVYPGDKSHIDNSQRVSESAVLPRDETVIRIEERALAFQGWRGNSTYMQPMKTQRYGVNGFYNFHYDWDSLVEKGNRVTTYMVYLVADCTGGGTNFPRLPRPNDTRWCNIIFCDDDEYDGVTFKPRVGTAVFWENIHSNGSFHRGVRHASLPVKSGQKIGLNIWGWDKDWRPPMKLQD